MRAPGDGLGLHVLGLRRVPREPLAAVLERRRPVEAVGRRGEDGRGPIQRAKRLDRGGVCEAAAGVHF